ncbi:MAG: thioredoxin [Anaerolineales bacterium]
MALSENILDVSEATFEEDVVMRSHEIPVVVDFWAPWCGPCRMLGPILERLAIEGGGSFVLAKLNVDDNPNLSIRYGVQGIPAVKAFRNGDVVAQFVGAQPEARVRRFIDNLAPDPAEIAVEDASSLLATRHYAEAEDAFSDVLAEDEGNPAAALGLVKSLLMQGKGEQAMEWLDHFPAGTEWATAEKLKPLASLLVEAAEGDEVEHDDPLEAQLHHSADLVRRGNLPAAMDGLLGVLRQDKRYRDGMPKDVLLALFAMLGDDDPLTREYRQELASVLF